MSYGRADIFDRIGTLYPAIYASNFLWFEAFREGPRVPVCCGCRDREAGNVSMLHSTHQVNHKTLKDEAVFQTLITRRRLDNLSSDITLQLPSFLALMTL